MCLAGRSAKSGGPCVARHCVNVILLPLQFIRAIAHDRYFSRSGETAAAADYFLAVRTESARNGTFSHFPVDVVQAVCALQKHEEFAVSQHVLRPYRSRNLDVARRGMCIWHTV